MFLRHESSTRFTHWRRQIEPVMTYDETVDASIITHQEGDVEVTLLHLDDVDLNLDSDAAGRVMSLEVSGASRFQLIGRYGGKLVPPERITDYHGFDVLELFPKALT